MIKGVAEGYVTGVKEHTVELPNVVVTLWFLKFCEAIDSYRCESYRYSYVPKKKGKHAYTVVVQDIGE